MLVGITLVILGGALIIYALTQLGMVQKKA